MWVFDVRLYVVVFFSLFVRSEQKNNLIYIFFRKAELFLKKECDQ